jgi:hypothetical protein
MRLELPATQNLGVQGAKPHRRELREKERGKKEGKKQMASHFLVE